MSDAPTKKLLEDNKSPLATPPQAASQPTAAPAAEAVAEQPEQWKENAKFAEDADWDEEDYDDQPDEGAAPSSKPAAEAVVTEPT